MKLLNNWVSLNNILRHKNVLQMTDFIELLYAKNNRTVHTVWLHWSRCATSICFSYLFLEIPIILKFILSVMECFANCLIMLYELRRNNSMPQTFCTETYLAFIQTREWIQLLWQKKNYHLFSAYEFLHVHHTSFKAFPKATN